jgi:fermentation-respiration switch protein FrsA (DUF1100 family)
VWLAGALLLAACSPQRAVESLEVLQAIAAGPKAQDAALETATDTHRLPYAFTVQGRTYQADLYLPGRPPLAALVLVPGAVREGKDDRRFVAFARALTKGRFLVLVPEIATLRELRVGPGDVTAIGDAVEHLASLTEAPAVGLVAISYMGGPAVIAALEAHTRDLLRFVVTVGGYYDIEAALTFFTTGHFREPGETAWRHAKPNPYGRWLFLRSNLERVEAPRDRIALERIATLKLRDPVADIASLAAGLTPEGRAILDLMTNRDPERTAQLISRLPSAVIQDMHRLDPAGMTLTDLRARLFAIHGRDDPVIPYSESMALTAAVGEDRARLALVDHLAHVDLTSPSLGDLLTLWQVVYEILEMRDGMPAPRPGAMAPPP